MALFSRKNKQEEVKAGAPVATTSAPSGVAHILRNPRITEKASLAMENSVYVFDVASNANKKMISAAVQGIYKVKPVKVAIVVNKPKSTRNVRTGKYGMTGGYKKAYVYLKKGETITVT